MNSGKNEKRWLSKSQINSFIRCPYGWKLQYIDKIESIQNVFMTRGKNIHSHIEEFYKKVKIENDKIVQPQTLPKSLNKFVQFEKKRLDSCKNKEGKIDIKYFKPLFQELYLQDEKLMLRGYLDSVYINPTDDKLIIIDYKTGHTSTDIDSYRLELSIYKRLLENSGKVKEEIKYWGILFIDSGILLFEEVNEKFVEDTFKLIEDIRIRMDSGEYLKNCGGWCKWCGLKGVCDKNEHSETTSE